MVQMSPSLICSRGKGKSNLQTNKAGGQKRGLPEVLGFTRFSRFHDLSRVLCLWFAFILTK